MALSVFQKNMHLLWRAGFGPSLNNLSEINTQAPAQVWQKMLQDSRDAPQVISGVMPKLDKAYIASLPSDTARKAAMQAYKTTTKLAQQQFASRWLQEMINSRSQLREKMAFFWSGHFATRITRVDMNRDLLQIFRQNALGNFGDLLLQVSKSSAMLAFLNNQQNRKQHPNENFAREVMELFTLGRGNYTEKDVKEGARAFTGWSYAVYPADSPQSPGETYFLYRDAYHDDGQKAFLGKTSAFKGEDIIRILLEQRQTARFITGKIYRYFVSETPDDKRIATLSKKFYDAKYDIPTLLTEIFTAPWFFEERNVGNRIKSPVELLAGMLRVLPVEIGNPRGMTILQNVLGQTLLEPPNVAGWPLGKAWIDSSSLLLRMELPYILAGTEALQVAPKPNDDIQMGKKLPEEMADRKPVLAPAILQSRILWPEVEKALGNLSDVQISEIILVRPEQAPVGVAENAIKNAPSNAHIRQYVLRLMSLPEYQLC